VLRSLKYGTFGAILAGLIAAPIMWATVDKSVTLVVDGKVQTVRTTTADVGQLLASCGYRVEPHDLVAPGANAPLHDGMRVVLRHGRLLHLDIDGARRDVWTTAPTVAAALAQLGYPGNDFVSVSRSRRLPLTPSSLTIRTPHAVTVIDHGHQHRLTTTDPTVGALLADLGVTVGSGDQVQPQPDAALADGTVVRIQQVVRKIVVRHETVGFATRRHTDANVLKGHTRVVQPGRRGVLEFKYALVYLDGKLIGRTKISSSVLRTPQARVIGVGTKPPPPPQQLTVRHRRAGGGSNASPAAAQAIAQRMVAARGWSSAQYSCLVVLWNHESGWHVDAYNASGAYGIPQALPGSKMASAGPNWRTDPTTQITWGLNYIASRYGTPCNAWYQWQANGGWY
jgi:resuscitation-promoting factor RpfB